MTHLNDKAAPRNFPQDTFSALELSLSNAKLSEHGVEYIVDSHCTRDGPDFTGSVPKFFCAEDDSGVAVRIDVPDEGVQIRDRILHVQPLTSVPYLNAPRGLAFRKLVPGKETSSVTFRKLSSLLSQTQSRHACGWVQSQGNSWSRTDHGYSPPAHRQMSACPPRS